LLRESLKFDDSYTLALAVLGKILFNNIRHRNEGQDLLVKFTNIVKQRNSFHSSMGQHELRLLNEIALLLNDQDLIIFAKNELDKLNKYLENIGDSQAKGIFNINNTPVSNSNVNITTY
jgi:hypothetical protein